MLRLLVAGSLLLAACTDEGSGPGHVSDPSGPAASGVMSLGAGVTAAGYQHLAIWLDRPSGYSSVGGDHPLPATWPTEFGVGGGIGSGPTGTNAYVVRAWLAAAAQETEPAAGEPHAETTVMINCSPVHEGWSPTCGAALDVMLELGP